MTRTQRYCAVPGNICTHYTVQGSSLEIAIETEFSKTKRPFVGRVWVLSGTTLTVLASDRIILLCLPGPPINFSFIRNGRWSFSYGEAMGYRLG